MQTGTYLLYLEHVHARKLQQLLFTALMKYFVPMCVTQHSVYFIDL